MDLHVSGIPLHLLGVGDAVDSNKWDRCRLRQHRNTKHGPALGHELLRVPEPLRRGRGRHTPEPQRNQRLRVLRHGEDGRFSCSRAELLERRVAQLRPPLGVYRF